MRIAFVGKGGSGKTTLSALFARHLASKGHPVLAIDADINQHMAVALGFPEDEASLLPALADDIRFIKWYLRGANPRIFAEDDMVKTTPPGKGSRLLSVTGENPIFSTFGRSVGGVLHLGTGRFRAEDIGIKCYHSKTGAAELLLNHLVDGAKEYVVVDMTAGADSFASGLFTRFDLTAVVVEPTKKSLAVFEQYRGYAMEYGVRLAVIGNKVESKEDEAFIRNAVGDALLCMIGRSPYVRASERGEVQPISELEPENQKSLAILRSTLDSCPKDWRTFYRLAVDFHIKNALSWANVSVGRDVREQIDPEFSYPT